MFGFEGIFERINLLTAQWLSWLERRPVTAEVVGSSPIIGFVPYTEDNHWRGPLAQLVRAIGS